MVSTIRQILSRFRDRCDGTILVETAVVVPIVVLMTMGGAEFARYVLLHQKLDRVAATVGDVIAQQDRITEQQVEDVFCSINDIMVPFEIGGDGVVFVTSVMIPETGTESDPAEIQWQRTKGTYSASSAYGSTPGQAVDVSPIVPQLGETIIIAEMFFAYKPFFFNQLIGPSEIYKRALFRPRLAKLDVVDGPAATPCPA